MEIDGVEHGQETAQPDGLTGVPVTPAPHSVGFRGVRWRWTDLVVGLAPLVVLRLAALWVQPGSFLAAPWLLLPATLFGMGWMVGYPLWLARRRRVPLPRPTLRQLAVEVALAFPTLLVIWGLLAVVLTAWTVLAGGQAPADPLTPVFRSTTR